MRRRSQIRKLKLLGFLWCGVAVLQLSVVWTEATAERRDAVVDQSPGVQAELLAKMRQVAFAKRGSEPVSIEGPVAVVADR